MRRQLRRENPKGDVEKAVTETERRFGLWGQGGAVKLFWEWGIGGESFGMIGGASHAP